ncbi:MAG: hypothetical protein Ct9H300mP1_08230 [Planctomycetaceae bacterium]|nr:MAG: hypothetical protein Ct9H300mP1_08230 [Planctomycetaceae bacterium]
MAGVRMRRSVRCRRAVIRKPAVVGGGRRVLEGVLEAMGGRAERVHWSEVVDRAHAEASRMGVRLIEGPAGQGSAGFCTKIPWARVEPPGDR